MESAGGMFVRGSSAGRIKSRRDRGGRSSIFRLWTKSESGESAGRDGANCEKRTIELGTDRIWLGF